MRKLLLVGAMALTILVPATASAFHDGGVGKCKSCHTMHISQNGRPQYHWNPNGNEDLLLYGNATDTCLMCHSSRGQFNHGAGFGPGGDFYWVTKTFTWTTPWGSTESSDGDSHGHNVISGRFDIAVDAQLGQAPGGEFLSARLGCTSCHDPHGNANFRMLYDSTLGPAYGPDERFAFSNDAPLARGNAVTTQAGAGGDETNARHTVYKSGMSAWCVNCHPGLHGDEAGTFRHPAGTMLTADVAAQYNAYVSTDDLNGGSAAVSYLGLVPFENVDVDLSLVDPDNETNGPDAGDVVMCLTCHRAHASPFADAGRWDFAATYLVEDSHPQITDSGATSLDVAQRYYGYTFVPSQRSLCNKCHAKDYGDRPFIP